jgi:hypothetical protein
MGRGREGRGAYGEEVEEEDGGHEIEVYFAHEGFFRGGFGGRGEVVGSEDFRLFDVGMGVFLVWGCHFGGWCTAMVR